MLNLILAHAEECAPAESCGFVINNSESLEYQRCINIADFPNDNFEISPDDWLKAYSKGEIIALVHSHPDGLPILSGADRIAQHRTALDWWLVCDGKIHKFRNVLPLLGRQFEYGKMDCYTVFKDAYHLAGIELSEFERTNENSERDKNLYSDNMEGQGFYKVEQVEPGDIILICLGGQRPNHAAVYCGNQYILHHCPQRLSKRDIYDGYWLNYTHSIWRHKKWQSFGFTAICNDMVASSNSML